MVFVDRKAKYPGRWTMKKSDGTSEIVTLVRNDEPEVEGTPMNAETLNTLSDVAGADVARIQAEAAREAAAGSATEAASSSSAAAESKTAAATSEANAAKHEEAAKKAAEEAGAKAGTDKTLSIENAPADAKATGDALAGKVDKGVILDEDGNVIFYSKAAVDELLAGKLDLTGGTMAGKLEFSSYMIRGGSILLGEEDAANAPGEPLNDLVIRSWNGVSFTTDCDNQTYTGKTAVGIDCREGIVKAARFEGKIDVNSIYPVGSIYMTVGADPASIFGGTWRLVAGERVLMGAGGGHSAGAYVDAGLPNITGDAYGDVNGNNKQSMLFNGSGALRTDTVSWGSSVNAYSVSNSYNNATHINFNANKSNFIYGKSSTVQPATYYVNIWQRVN